MDRSALDPEILDALNALFAAARGKTIRITNILTAVPSASRIKGQSDLLAALEHLETQGKLKLPSKTGRGWQPHGILPLYLTLAKIKEDRAQQDRKTQLARIREETPWVPQMASFAPALTTQKQLAQAQAVNRYFIEREKECQHQKEVPIALPHRERALEIFGNEKALDSHVHRGLFSGNITLDDLDCFYCPEPLPYEMFSFDPQATWGRPLLLVENSATYWSCCQANQAGQPRGGGYFAAVVFGKGFKASRSTPIQSLDSLVQIERRTRAGGILYFGDLDPAGLTIPQRINANREKTGQPGMRPALALYRALLKKDLKTGYGKPQEKFHDAQWARQWLGPDLGDAYLADCLQARWPQEGLTARDIAQALSQNS